ncbi:MAG TPA: HD domain-containing protein [Candidatus Yonathbacteria bacterium]|nr:HD domain-containing protein [Candidatus Yonathbacteria bacterium]
MLLRMTFLKKSSSIHIKDKILRTVGEPLDRFSEDALRMLRAVRLATQLGFTININTFNAVVEHSKNLKTISQERLRDEFSKIIGTDNPMEGIILAHKIGVLQYIAPELEVGIGVDQNGIHIYDVWEHNLRSLQHASDKNYSFHVKLAALLHDVGKPISRRWSKENNNWTFYGHDVVGGRVSREMLKRLRFSRETIDVVSRLVRYHMFFSDVDQITLSAVRRIIVNVGKEHIWELIDLRTCDRIGTGRPKEIPYRLRKYQAMIDEALHDPISVGMLKIDGQKILDVTREKPGPKIGFILHALLEEVLDDPKRNTEIYLEKRTSELIKMSVAELKALGEQGKEKKDTEEKREVAEIRKKRHVE